LENSGSGGKHWNLALFFGFLQAPSDNPIGSTKKTSLVFASFAVFPVS
jgi:hypothetical protein